MLVTTRGIFKKRFLIEKRAFQYSNDTLNLITFSVDFSIFLLIRFS
jgi:hypothetical protein